MTKRISVLFVWIALVLVAGLFIPSNISVAIHIKDTYFVLAVADGLWTLSCFFFVLAIIYRLASIFELQLQTGLIRLHKVITLVSASFLAGFCVRMYFESNTNNLFREGLPPDLYFIAALGVLAVSQLILTINLLRGIFLKLRN
jgi:hypothetical protein